MESTYTSVFRSAQRDFTKSIKMLKAAAEGMMKGASDVSENAPAKNELLAKIISTLIGLTASFTITYFGVRYLMNAMDPTQKDKKEARERVSCLLFLLL